jgi:RHS repeat-associated protein
MKHRSAKKSSLIGAISSVRAAVAQLLIACLLLQFLAPAALASAPDARTAAVSHAGLASRTGATLRGLAVGAGNMAAAALAFARAALTPQENWNVVLTPLGADFHDHTGLDYHQPSKKLILSANSPSGAPHSFELLGGDGGHSAFSNVAGFGGEVRVASARDDGQGQSRGGFHPGELFTGNGVAGAVARISADGATVQNPWVVLPGETGLVSGLHVDRTGAFGGDLVVVTTAGGVWRVNSAAVPTRVAALDTPLAGVVVVPDAAERYGPWAGRALVGAKEQGSVYALNPQGQADPLQVGLNPQDIDIVPAHENFFAVDSAGRKLLGAPEGAFAGIIGDIIVTQESPGVLARVRWDGVGFVVGELAQAGGFEQVAFSPAGVTPIPAVRQLYDKIAVVRHAPQLNSGRVEGTLWQLTAESVLLDGTDTITSDLLVPGTPSVTATESSAYGGTVEGTEGAQPAGYTVTVKGNASLRHVVTRTDPIEVENIPLPPAPAGARDVELRRAGETIGDPATLRHLNVSGNVGSAAVPPGTYGRFTVGGRNTLVLGVEGSAAPSVYNLEELSLTGGSQLRLAGPVTLRVRNRVTLVGSTVGAADDPKRLLLEIADGNGLAGDALKVTGTGVLYAVVRAPQGDVTVEGAGRVRGTVTCDYLFVNGNGVLQITENDMPPPPVNRPPTADAGPDHTITLPTDTTALEGAASDDGLPAGSTLAVTWTKVSGPDAVTFADPHSAATSATFGGEGVYVLRLTASDGQLSSSDTTTVTVIARNQAPTVEAGEAQTIELPAGAELRGTVADDALPRGSTVTSTWSVVGGPGAVTFADPHAVATTAAFGAPGVYTLRLSASDTEFTVSDDVVVTVLKNEPPVVNAGPDQEFALPNVAALGGTATDDGLPRGSTLEVSWGVVSGPGPVVFNDSYAAATVATFTAPGTYVLRLTASDSQLTASDELTVVVRPQPYTSRTYTLDSDFDEGALLNLTHSTPNQLQLDSTTRTLSFIWVAVSTKGTVVKINTETGAIIGEYFTSPAGQPKDPSRTTVDQNGNVWATNREGNSVVHIGLVENGQCVDRNNNGSIETSTGFGDIKPWPNTNGANTNGGVTLAQDECVIHYTKVNSFGTRHVSVNKDNDIWVSGTNGQRFDLIDGKTGLVKRSEPSVGYGGYGGLIDKNNVIWSANPMLRWDTSKPLTGPNALNGMAFTLYGGRATWDRAGRASTQTSPSERVWVEDRAPEGAALAGDSEGWNWTGANPAPFSGTLAHQSNLVGGTHQHYFHGAPETLSVGAGDSLFTYVYLDPANPPSEVMLQWNNGNWEHRAYWGQNIIGWGVNGTESRRHMGPLPALGQWVKLEVPASQVGLEGSGANWRGYSHPSYGLCIDSRGNVYNTSYGNGTVRKFAPDGTLVGTYSQGYSYAQGCVVDRNDHVWIAHSLNGGTVGHMKSDGTYVGNVTVGSGPTGVAVDGAGKVWATNYYSRTVSRISPALGPLGPDGVTRVGAVDFTTRDLGGNPYNYSDMTGSTLTAAPLSGTWSVIFDSKVAGAEWGRVGWAAQVCGDAQLNVSVATGENGTTFGPAAAVANGADPVVANGRYIKVSVAFKRASSGESPVLHDLSVGTVGYTLPTPQNAAPAAFAGPDQTTTLPDAARLSGAACDDGFPRGNAFALSWSKVSGPGAVAFNRPNSTLTDATFTVAGEYVLRLTASDGEHSVSDEVTVTALPANMAPIVNAGPDQTVTLPNTVALNGTVSDDGLPTGGTLTTFWSQLGGPGVVKFDEPGSPATRAVFPTPGTYTLRLAGNDTHRVGTDDVTVTINASPALVGATLSLAAGNVGPYVTGTMQPLRATLKNSAGGPLANYGVEFEVTGPNATTGGAVTDAAGVATFNYSGTNEGTDTVRALVRNTATETVNSNAVSMAWAVTAVSPPTVQGWIGAPLNGSTVTAVVPVTVGAGQTLTQAKVEYWPAANPSAVTVLAEGAQGGPGATLAALDTTLLANGNYVIRLTATDSAGQELVSQVLITVAGENKPGRMTLTVTDVTVPATGIPITVERRYDSLERNTVGDFGYGWSLEMAGPRLEVSPDHDVTITEPGTGRRVTFQFAPQSFGFPFGFLNQPTYTPEPGVYGKLTSDGCGALVRSGGGVICLFGEAYSPTTYAYTDPYGRVYTVSAGGQMRSIKNVDGNVLTFSPSGITSSAGNLTVPITRDSQGRVTEIRDPAGKVYQYTYDAAGDLTAVKLPDVATPLRYEYDPGHFFRKGIDARGNAAAATTYYPNGRLQSVTDAMGKTTGYAYDLAANTTTVTYPDGAGSAVQRFDANGLLLSETNPLNETRSYTYDARRNRVTETDALQKTTTLEYDAGGHLSKVTDPLGKRISYANNSVGLPVTVTDQTNKVKSFKYDEQSNVVGISDELGEQLAFTWNEHGSPLSLTDGNGKTTRFTYDAYGNILTKTDPLGRTTSYAYDGMGRVSAMTDARGTTRFAYDGMGRLVSVADPLNQETKYAYDGNGNRVEEIDARQQITRFEYDAANRLVKTNYPDGTSSGSTYNFRDQKVTETDQLGRTTRYDYDNAGRLVKAVYPDQSEVAITYDAAGRVKTATNELGKVFTYEYDPNCGCRDRVTSIVDPYGKTTTYRYDDAGRRVSFTDANGRETRYEHDARGRLVKTTFPDGTTKSTAYDAMGRPTAATDQEGRATRYAYDDAGNILSVTDAKGGVTQYGYDALDNLLSTTDAMGRATRFEYDALNRLIKRTLPLGMSELYTYDQLGNLATRTDFRGKQTSYDYDPMNRLTARRPDASLGEPSVTYTYTATGRRRTMADASGTTTYAYDERDRLLSKQTPQGTLTHTYDRAGNLTSTSSSNAEGVSVAYTYDDLNRLATVVDRRGGASANVYTYDAVGNLKSDLRANGVQADYTYNAVNRLTGLTVGRGGAPQAGYAYTLDRTGRRLSATEQGGRTVGYTYDAVYRLTREAVAGDPVPANNGAVDYTYDAVSNRLSRVSSLAGVLSETSNYDANDRLTSEAYDANGNARSVSGRTFAYDSENRIQSANGGAVRLTYDGDGNLASKTAGGVTTRYLTDDANPTGYSQVVEEVVGGQVQRQYTYGNAIISQRRRDGNGGWYASFYSVDGHGSVRQLTDASGAVTDTYAYDAFGKVVAQTGSTPNAYLYRGERYDADLGLYHLRARHYNADRGRFMSLDPYQGDIDEPQSLHRYLYANADPVNFIDPTGLSSSSEYGFLTRISIAIRPALRALGRAIVCVFLRVASFIASVSGYEEWATVMDLASQLFLRHCPCKLTTVVDVALEVASSGYPGPYSHLEDPPNVGPDKPFDAKQKENIYEENRKRNGGILRDDDTGEPLEKPQKSRRGVTPPPNEAQIDHINPRKPADPNVPPGTNSYKNAKVISRKRNRAKSNKCIR